MYKVILFFIICIFSSSVSGEDEYDLGEKKVIGEDKRIYNEDVKIIKRTNENNIPEDDIDIKIKEEKIKPLDISDEDFLTKDKNSSVIWVNYNRGINNRILFGLGGYRKVDSFRYLIDYTKEDYLSGLAYYFHVERSIRGEDRRNSDIDKDGFKGKIWYKNIYIGLSHSILDEDFPGRDDKNIQVNSYKGEKLSEFNFEAGVFSDNKDKLNIGTEIYSEKVISPPTFEREYENNFYDFYVLYDTLNNIGSLENYMKIRGGYYRDNMPEDKRNSLNLSLESKIKPMKNRSISFDIKVTGEWLNRIKDRKDENYLVFAGIHKYFNRKFGVGISFEKENLNQRSRDILNNFEFDNDILPFSCLKNDDNFKAEFMLDYNLKNIYFESRLRYLISQNKIIYVEDYSITGETVIKVQNYNKKLSSQEVELKTGYVFSILRGEMKYIYSTLSKIPFNPVHRFIFSLIFNYSRFENKIEGKYYSSMYGDLNKKYKMNEYKNLDMYNKFRFNELLSLSLNILNIIDFNSRKKSGYYIDGRKIMMEMNIKY